MGCGEGGYKYFLSRYVLLDCNLTGLVICSHILGIFVRLLWFKFYFPCEENFSNLCLILEGIFPFAGWEKVRKSQKKTIRVDQNTPDETHQSKALICNQGFSINIKNIIKITSHSTLRLDQTVWHQHSSQSEESIPWEHNK